MLSIILLMLAGIALGLFAGTRPRLKAVFQIAGKVQRVGTVILLFAMGVWLGGNGEFWANLRILGLHGALFALFTVIGSAACVYLLTKLAFPREDKA